MESYLSALEAIMVVSNSSIDFNDYYNKNDIRYKKTILYSPQLNGIAKRMNKTLTERFGMRCLQQSCLSSFGVKP